MTDIHLSRRTLLFSAATLLMTGKACAQLPYALKLLWAGFDGAVYHGGLQILLQPGWKTYWRVPGAGGIPPSIEVSGSNVGAFSFECPLPQRIAGEEGEAIGYKTEVVFPFVLTPHDKAAAVNASMRAFVGVCDTICIPVPFEETTALQPLAMVSREAPLLAQWRAKVPQLSDKGPVLSVAAAEDNGKLQLDVTLVEPIEELFVEGQPSHTFEAPKFSADRLSARLLAHGAKSLADIQGKSLRLTLVHNGRGLEQSLTVS